MLRTSLTASKNLLWCFVKYYLAAVLVLTVRGEIFNLALRYWSDNQMSFYAGGLWQLTFILAFFVALYAMLARYLT